VKREVSNLHLNEGFLCSREKRFLAGDFSTVSCLGNFNIIFFTVIGKGIGIAAHVNIVHGKLSYKTI